METLDQGSIFGGLRSDKYPTMECYGIILTASCDIAHSKVPKLYYATALDVIEWGCMRDTYLTAYKPEINNKQSDYYQSARQYRLSPELLESYDRDTVIQILENEISSEKKRKSLLTKYDDYMLLRDGINDVQSVKKVIEKNDVPLTKLLKEITDGKQHHYHFIPSTSYTKQKEVDGGLIVDFQEINWISIEDAYNIINPGIDNLIIADYPAEQQELYKRTFWLEKPDAYVHHLGKIESPWREHLMQRFSHCFARIGLQDITEKGYSNIIKRMVEKK